MLSLPSMPCLSATGRTLVLPILVITLLFRLFLSTHSYSGQNAPPSYGDYEAQRNWMSVTRNLPLSEWYVNSSRNDLGHWGLDYPPGSAYQSFLSGWIVGLFDPTSVGEPEVSRGVEGVKAKVGMRLSVLVGDLWVYVPGCLYYWWCRNVLNPSDQSSLSLFWLLANPALLLIDHGHFQYNSISLGFTILATACLLRRSNYLGSFFFCMALNHKQMTLYYAPAFFAYLLTACACQETRFEAFKMFTWLGLTVVAACFLLWAPFGVDGAKHILIRIFPMQRGLYEDYVANFWCVSSMVYKWRLRWEKGVLAKMCLVATLGACLPTLILGSAGVRKGRDVFVLMLAGVSLSFYLFSFQVHEKSILMPLTAITMLGNNKLTAKMQCIAMMTMFPLLKKDGLAVAYWAMQGLTAIVGGWDWSVHSILAVVHCIGAFVHVEGKPFLEDAVMMAAGFLFFVWVWFWVVWRLWMEVGVGGKVPAKQA